MAVKLLKNYPSQNIPMFVYRVALIHPPFSHTYFLYTLVYKSSIPTLVFGVNSPLHHDLTGELAHCKAMLSGSSLWDVRGEPAMCSVTDFGTRAGD